MLTIGSISEKLASERKTSSLVWRTFCDSQPAWSPKHFKTVTAGSPRFSQACVKSHQCLQQIQSQVYHLMQLMIGVVPHIGGRWLLICTLLFCGQLNKKFWAKVLPKIQLTETLRIISGSLQRFVLVSGGVNPDRWQTFWVSKLSITGPSATSVEAAYKMLVYEAHQRCKAAGLYPVRPNIARAVALLFHEVVWDQVREKNNAMHVQLQDPRNLVRKKELESQRLDEVMARFGVQLEMHEAPMRKGRLWQGEAAKLHGMCQAVATFVDVSNDAVLTVVGPCTFFVPGG